MKTTSSTIHEILCNGKSNRSLFLYGAILIFLLICSSNCTAQSIVNLNNAGTNDWNFHNSVSDEQGNIYYCTRDRNNNNTLNITCISKQLLLVWSYNYNLSGIEPVSGINYINGKIHITTTTTANNNMVVLVLDLFGNILFSKQIKAGSVTFASEVMHNNDLLLTTSYNQTEGSVHITRLTPAFTTVFNKRIQFNNRDFVYIDHIKQIGNRIYFGGSARLKASLVGYWFFGALELNGNLAFLHEYEVENNDTYPNHHFGEMDSVSTDLIITSGYTSNVTATGTFNSYAQGVLVKMNPKDGSVIDHLILTPVNIQDWMFFFGMKYQANNKIRISGTQGINLDFDNRGILFGEVDLDFKNYRFKFSTNRGANTWINRFTDYDHASGSLLGEPFLMTVEGMGTCKSTNDCFEEALVISVNKAFNPVFNNYTLTDINYDIENTIIQKKPIPASLSINCGTSICEDSHTIQICKQHYVYDYGAISQNPGPVNNLSPTIANMMLDRINKKMVIDPIKSGTALIVMETQINLFLKQLDTFKFVILNDSLPVLDLGPDKTLCNGDSVILRINLDSIHWSDGTVRKSITVKKAGVYWASYSNQCGSVADTIVITTQTSPKLNLGNDLLLCGNQSGTLSSNYDNTIWSNGGMGRNIVVNTAGKIVGFVSTACGISFDTVEVFKFDRNSFSAGPDQQICDPLTNLVGSFTNPNPKLYSSEIEWKQIDALPAVVFDDIHLLNPMISNLTKDKLHAFELNLKIDNGCILKDTIHVFSKTCLIDSCAFIIEKNCLPNGMVELKALDANSQTIIPKVRVHELFWDIKDGPAGRGYSIVEKNPVIVSNHTRFSLTSKIYLWSKIKPHTIEFADICEFKSADSLTLACTGPCEDFSFILSSCLDDYDVENNLNYPPQLCKSVCDNNCDYIIGIFDLNGNMIDSKLYEIKWSTGESGSISMQKGCFNYVISVDVKKGDCIWHGRYRPSCSHHNGFGNTQSSLNLIGSETIDMQSLKLMMNAKQEFTIYNTTGQYVGRNEFAFTQLPSGLYFIETMKGSQKVVNKIFVSEHKY